MMLLKDILPDQRRIFTSIKTSNQKNLFEHISDVMSGISPLSSSAISEALFTREKIASTAMGMGVAIPHARFAKLEKTMGAFFQLEKPIEFDAPDHKPVDLLFLLLVPENSGADHLKILAQLSRLFRTQGVPDKLRDARDKEDILRLIIGEDVRQVA